MPGIAACLGRLSHKCRNIDVAGKVALLPGQRKRVAADALVLAGASDDGVNTVASQRLADFGIHLCHVVDHPEVARTAQLQRWIKGRGALGLCHGQGDLVAPIPLKLITNRGSRGRDLSVNRPSDGD